MVVGEIALKSGLALILRALKSRFHCTTKYRRTLSLVTSGGASITTIAAKLLLNNKNSSARVHVK